MAEKRSDDPTQHLSIDWRVNVGWMAGLALQTVVLVISGTWYASKTDSRIEYIERRVFESEGKITSADRDARDISSRLIRLEEKSVSMLEILRSIQSQLGPQRRTELDRP